ncbi:hypothetical protein GQL56_00320 [Pseudomonas putida]|nr:hypothetical protein [Pseudomonas putida]
MNFAQAFAQLNTPAAPVCPVMQRKADVLHEQILRLVEALARSSLVPGADTLH